MYHGGFMEKAKITFKGQVTIPKKIRVALSIAEGDSVIFSIEGDHAVVRPLKKMALDDFYGSFSATRPYPGLDAMRKEVREKMADRFQKESKK
jgi:AbrB family looped-hinge helix DNA binding protein